jgi:phosphatidylglycerophosphatase A
MQPLNPSPKSIMDKLILFLATGAYSGYLPKAPGTWGSLVGVLLWFALAPCSPLVYALTVLALCIGGTFVSGSAEKILDQGDPGVVVIDEIAGQLIALAFVPVSPLTALLGFALFRFFDILKPFPVSWLDQHIHGGLGIMLDDVAAGLAALALLHAGLYLFM